MLIKFIDIHIIFDKESRPVQESSYSFFFFQTIQTIYFKLQSTDPEWPKNRSTSLQLTLQRLDLGIKCMFDKDSKDS